MVKVDHFKNDGCSSNLTNHKIPFHNAKETDSSVHQVLYVSLHYWGWEVQMVKGLRKQGFRIMFHFIIGVAKYIIWFFIFTQKSVNLTF